MIVTNAFRLFVCLALVRGKLYKVMHNVTNAFRLFVCLAYFADRYEDFDGNGHKCLSAVRVLSIARNHWEVKHFLRQLICMNIYSLFT